MPTLTTAGLGGRAAGLLTLGLGTFAGPGGATPATPGVYRDDAVMEDAAQRLADLDLFTAVYFGMTPDEHPAPSSASYAVAWVWDEMAENQEIFPGSGFTERVGMFGVAIEVRDQNPLERKRRLARLEAEAMNALQGRKLAGATYPNSVKVQRQGRDRTVNHPSARSVLVGRFRYPVGGRAAADDTDRESAWN